MQEIRANTQTIVRIGPVVNYKNSRQPITDLDITTVDQAELLKYGGGATVDISGNTWAAITGCDGWYNLTLTTGNLNTEGIATIVIQDSSECLPVFVDVAVLSQAAWDSKYAKKDTGYMDVNIKALGDGTQSATDLKDFADSGYDPATHKVQGVLLTDTCTSNSDMRGTDGANTVTPDSAGTAAVLHSTTDGLISTVDTVVDAIKSKTDKLPADPASESTVIAEIDANETKIDSNIALTTANQVILGNINGKMPSKAFLSGSADADGGIDDAEKTALVNAILDEAMSGHTIAGSFGAFLNALYRVKTGRWKIDDVTNQIIYYEADNTTPLFTFNLFAADGSPTSSSPYERVPV